MRHIDNRIVTYSGVEFWPLDARPEEVNIVDIAHALSNMARFNGHLKHFYSVAQHSVHVSWLVPQEDGLWGLLHDASEAYLADLTRPVKYQLPQYREIESRLMQVIAEAFHLPWPEPGVIKHADNSMLLAESRDLRHTPVPGNDHTSLGDATAYSGTITPWEPKRAKDAFLRRYRELTMPAAFRPCVGGSCGWEADLAELSTIRIAEDFANREKV